jgi:hypothetical protein
MKNINWWKIGSILVILLACFYVGCEYNSCNSTKPIVKKDSIITKYKDSIVYVPTPYKIDSLVYKYTNKNTVIIDSCSYPVYYSVHVDTELILKKYFNTLYYSDTAKLKRGIAIINDTVSTNKIIGRSISVSESDTSIETTIIKTQPKKVILFWNATALNNFAIGTGISLKFKTDLIITANAFINTDNKLIYQGVVHFPIHLKRR